MVEKTTSASYTVKGVTFTKDKLETIKLSELSKLGIAPGHVFLFVNSKPFLLLRAGDIVDKFFIDKYSDKGVTSISFLPINNSECIEDYNYLWGKLRDAKLETHRKKIRDRIIKKFHDDYWSDDGKVSLLNFIFSCYQSFNRFENTLIEEFHESNTVFYIRALSASAISTITSLSNGFTDFCFISDVYNTTLALDISLIKTGLSYHMVNACEAERNGAGNGMAYLERNKCPEGEMYFFTKHPELSFNYISQQENLFYYPEVAQAILYHHEKCDGSGFPNGISYAGISSWESITSFCDYVIPFKEHIFHSRDGKSLMKDYFYELKESESMFSLPILKTMNYFEQAMNWASKKKPYPKFVEETKKEDEEEEEDIVITEKKAA